MDINVILTIVGTIIGIVSATIAFLQLRYQIIARTTNASNLSITSYHEEADNILSVFAAHARVLGMTKVFVNRVPELGILSRELKTYKNASSIILINGIAGSGKSTLASKIVQNLSRNYRKHYVRWVFCAEHDLTLTSLARSLAFDESLRHTDKLQRLVLKATATEQVVIIDALIELLSAEKIVLVLDNVQLVTDNAIQHFIEVVASSQIQSVLLLTSRERLGYLNKGDSVLVVEIDGLSEKDSLELLKLQGLDIHPNTYRKIHERTGGIPQALEIIVGLEEPEHMYEIVDGLPIYSDNFFAWVNELYGRLSATELQIVQVITILREPATFELLASFIQDESLRISLNSLIDKLILDDHGQAYTLHDIIEEYSSNQLSLEDKSKYANIITQYFRGQARGLLRGEKFEPSYGLAYLEAFPEYVNDSDRHVKHVTLLVEKLREKGFSVHEGDRILVLGAGHGTHDLGFSKFGLNVVNVDFTKEVVELGRTNAQALPNNIEYILADMTLPLDIELNSFDIAFNIGSSFGFEDEDQKNAEIFKNAYRTLKPGAPFVFSYVNGKRNLGVVSRDIEVTELPNGSIRTTYGVKNPFNSTSLTAIRLERLDGSVSRFYHFMHYYSPDEVKGMMIHAGFEILSVYGTMWIDGAPYESTSEFDPEKSTGMWIIAQKPASLI